MRFLLLAACATIISAADVESFILRDGRKLVGTYDESSQTLTLVGSPSVSIKVRERDIEKREPADPQVVKALEKPVQKTHAPEKAAPTETKNTAGKLADLAAVALADKYTEANRLRDQATEVEISAMMAWMASVNLDPLPVPVLSDDPKKSEYEAKRKTETENECRRQLRHSLEMMRAAKTANDKRNAISAFQGAIKRLGEKE